jgi:hypothetical protein
MVYENFGVLHILVDYEHKKVRLPLLSSLSLSGLYCG